MKQRQQQDQQQQEQRSDALEERRKPGNPGMSTQERKDAQEKAQQERDHKSD